MIINTQGIVLRTVRYGETSIITSIYTKQHGVIPFLIKGVRKTGSRNNKSIYFQPGRILDLVYQYQDIKNFQFLKDYQLLAHNTTPTIDIVKQSIGIFSIEVLLRLLPPNSPAPELFDYSLHFLFELEKKERDQIADLPIRFIINCSRFLGYEINGNYSEATPYLNLNEGGFSENQQYTAPHLNFIETKTLYDFLTEESKSVSFITGINKNVRIHILQWLIAYLQIHTKHMSEIKSLDILTEILSE